MGFLGQIYQSRRREAPLKSVSASSLVPFWLDRSNFPLYWSLSIKVVVTHWFPPHFVKPLIASANFYLRSNKLSQAKFRPADWSGLQTIQWPLCSSSTDVRSEEAAWRPQQRTLHYYLLLLPISSSQRDSNYFLSLFVFVGRKIENSLLVIGNNFLY